MLSELWPESVFLAMWLVAVVLGLWLCSPIVRDLRAMYRKRRTRRQIRQWQAEDARQRARERGYAADGSDVIGELLIDRIRERYDGLPVKGRR